MSKSWVSRYCLTQHFPKWVEARYKNDIGCSCRTNNHGSRCKQATRIIEALASTEYQAQHDKHAVQPKKGVLELNTTDAILAQNKILTQQIETLTKQMSNLPKQLHVVQSSQGQNQAMKCDFCGGNHPNGHCSYQNHQVEEEVQYMSNQGRHIGLIHASIIIQ